MKMLERMGINGTTNSSSAVNSIERTNSPALFSAKRSPSPFKTYNNFATEVDQQNCLRLPSSSGRTNFTHSANTNSSKKCASSSKSTDYQIYEKLREMENEKGEYEERIQMFKSREIEAN